MTQLIQLPPDTNSFEANGTTYTFEEHLSVERYRRFELLRLEAGFGASLNDLIDVLKQNCAYMDRIATGEKVFSEMAVLNYNTLKGIGSLVNKKPFAVWLCTLFFNTKDEDRRLFDEEVMRKKIIDWEEAGISARFFILKACAMINAFNDVYKTITQSSLGWMPGELEQMEANNQGLSELA